MSWTLQIGDEEGRSPRLSLSEAAQALEARIGRDPAGDMLPATDADIAGHLRAIAAAHGYRHNASAEARTASFWPGIVAVDARPIGFRRGRDGSVKVAP